MRIKLAIIDPDENYLQKIVLNFAERLSDKVEVYGFSTIEHFIHFLNKNVVDIVLVIEDWYSELPCLPHHCTRVCLIGDLFIESIDGVPAICKYQRPLDIYRQLLALYSENLTKHYRIRYPTTDQTQLILISGVAGGVGNSTIAAAYCMQQVQAGKKVLYLTTDQIGITAAFFNGSGLKTFSDVIFAAKSGQANLLMKIQSCIKEDEGGVHYIEACQSALDLLELSEVELRRVLCEIYDSNLYHVIVIDHRLSFDICSQVLFQEASQILLVTSGYPIANLKLQKILQSVRQLESQISSSIFEKIYLIYNQFMPNFSVKTQLIAAGKQLNEIPEFVKVDPKETTRHIAQTANISLENKDGGFYGS